MFVNGNAHANWRAIRVRPELVAAVAFVTVLALIVLPGLTATRAGADPVPFAPPTPGRLAYSSQEDFFQYLATTDDITGEETPVLPEGTSPPGTSSEANARAGLITWIDEGRAIKLLRDGVVTTVVPAVENISNSHPVISPNGDWIAYTAYDYSGNGVSHIWRVRVDGTEKTQVTTAAVSDTWPTWAPDGENLAFARHTTNASSNDIWRIHVPTGALTRLTSQAAQEDEPAWSLDGLRIAFTARGLYTDPETSYPTTEIVSIPAGGGDPRRELYPYWPLPSTQAVWTEDGSDIDTGLAFTSLDPGYSSTGIYQRIIDGTVITIHDEPDLTEDEPFLSGEFGEVGYTADRRQDTSLLHTIRVDGLDRQPFSDHWDDRESDPGYSPDGTKLAFSRATQDRADIVIADLITGTETLLRGPRPGFSEFYVDPTWSADGRFIAYGHEFTKLVVGEDPTPVSAIAVAEVATGQRNELPVETSTNGYSYSFDAEPSWDPAGARIVFARSWVPRGGGGVGIVAAAAFPGGVDSDLYLTPFPFPADVRATQLTNDLAAECASHDCLDRAPAWNPADATKIVFSRDFNNLVIVDPAVPATLTTLPVNDDSIGGVGDPAWNPTGTQLAFTGYESEGYPSIWLLPPDGGTPTHLTSTPRSVGQPAYQSTSDLTVTATVDAGTIEFGAQTTIRITVVNLGLSTVKPTVTLTIPPGLSVVSMTPDAGTCDVRAYTCTRPPLVAGIPWTVAIVVTGVQAGLQTVTADVTGPLADPNSQNNRAVTRVTVGDPPDLALTGAITPAPGYVGGEKPILTFTIHNGLQAKAHDVALSVDFPVSMPAPISANPPACLANPCLLGDMAPGDVRVVTYTIDPISVLDVNAVGVLFITGTDPDLLNNVATVRIRVVQPVIEANPGISPPGRVILATGKDFPPGATVGFRWSEGISAEEIIEVKPDGTFTVSVLIFNRDAPGERELVARYLQGVLFGDVKAPFLVEPGDQGPPDFVGRR